MLQWSTSIFSVVDGPIGTGTREDSFSRSQQGRDGSATKEKNRGKYQSEMSFGAPLESFIGMARTMAVSWFTKLSLSVQLIGMSLYLKEIMPRKNDTEPRTQKTRAQSLQKSQVKSFAASTHKHRYDWIFSCELEVNQVFHEQA